MTTSSQQKKTRRDFLGKLASGSAAVAAAGAASGLSAAATPAASPAIDGAAEAWLRRIRGQHKQFFDAMTINDGFSLGFALDFLDAYNQAFKVPDSALCAIVGLRHFSIPIAFTDAIWARYKLGEFSKVMDPATKQPLTRNMYYNARAGELPLPGMSIEKLQARGVTFTVCNVALTLLSSLTAKTAGVTPEVAKQEWIAGLIPGMTIVPSGVYAVNRAQEKGCTYCSAG